MANIYRNLIIKKLKTIEDVPEFYKPEVLRLLEAEGFDGYGNPLI
jgi:hypothetical protein